MAIYTRANGKKMSHTEKAFSFLQTKIAMKGSSVMGNAKARGPCIIQMDHPLKGTIRQALNHPVTELAVTAERSFLRKMEGGCHIPLFGLATIVGDKLVLDGGIAEEDGSRIIRERVEGSAKDAEALGELLASRVLNSGATQIINAYAQKN